MPPVRSDFLEIGRVKTIVKSAVLQTIRASRIVNALVKILKIKKKKMTVINLKQNVQTVPKV